MLTEQKRYKEWLKEVDSTALIQSLRNLETAFERFFKGISNYPKYKSKYNPVQSYKTMNINNNIRIDGRRIRLPKVGMIKFHTKRIITGEISSVTIRKKNSGKYYAAILCKDVPIKSSKKNRRSCGIDLGITNFVTINTGEIIRFPEQNKIKHLDKKKRDNYIEAYPENNHRAIIVRKIKKSSQEFMKKYTIH